MKVIAHAIGETLKAPEDEAVRKKTLSTVEDLCKKFPLYENKLQAVR